MYHKEFEINDLSFLKLKILTLKNILEIGAVPEKIDCLFNIALRQQD